MLTLSTLRSLINVNPQVWIVWQILHPPSFINPIRQPGKIENMIPAHSYQACGGL